MKQVASNVNQPVRTIVVRGVCMMIKMLFFVKINLSICCEEQLFDLFKDRVSVFILALVETWRYLGFSMVMLSQRFFF